MLPGAGPMGVDGSTSMSPEFSSTTLGSSMNVPGIGGAEVKGMWYNWPTI